MFVVLRCGVWSWVLMREENDEQWEMDALATTRLVRL